MTGVQTCALPILGLALQVLDARMKAWRFRHGGDVPMQLSFYEPAIVHACKHLARTGWTGTESPDAAPVLLRLMDELPELSAAAQDHVVRARAYGQAFELLDGALRENAPEPQEDALLAKVRAAMLRTARQGLDAVAEAELAQALALAPGQGLSKIGRAHV